MQPGCLDLVVRKRRGFVRLALEAKAALVPVIAFGEGRGEGRGGGKDRREEWVGEGRRNEGSLPPAPDKLVPDLLRAAPVRPPAGENDQFRRMDLPEGSLLDCVQKLFKKVGRGLRGWG